MRKITLDEIDLLLVDVSEDILPSHLYEFAKFQFAKNGINLSSNSLISYYYLKQSNSYFLSHFKSVKKSYYIEPLIIKAYYLQNEEKNTTDLFILNNYFAVYENQKLVFFKVKNQDVLDTQIDNYLKHSLYLKIDRIIHLDTLEEENLQKKFEENFSQLCELNTLKQSSNKELKKFIAFCIACLFLVGGLKFYDKFFNDSSNVEVKQKYFHPQKKLLTAKLLNALNQIQNASLGLNSIQLKQKDLNLVLKHKNKEQLLKFLTTNKGEIKSLEFNNQEGVYELNVLLKSI